MIRIIAVALLLAGCHEDPLEKECRKTMGIVRVCADLEKTGKAYIWRCCETYKEPEDQEGLELK